MITINNISKSFGDKILFKNLNLTIYDGEKIGIIGINGSGKSTLLSIIAGKLESDSGNISTTDNICFIEQSREFSEKAYNEVTENIAEKIEFAKTNKQLNLNKNIEFNNDRLKNLSGGEKTKFIISKTFAKSPTTIILDEPTNYLDMNGIVWLENKINNFSGTVLIVSHDRDFLNKTVNKIWELDNGNLNEFYGNYNDYKNQRQEQLSSLNKKYNNQITLQRKLEHQIKELKEKASKLDKKAKRDGSSDSRTIGYKNAINASAGKFGKTAQAKETRLEKEKKNFIEKPKEEKEIFYNLSASKIASKLLIKADNLGKSFDGNTLFENSNFTIESGEKIALIGNNGSGKTTLLKILLGLENYTGNLWKSQNLKIAYLSQEMVAQNEECTIFDIASNFVELKSQFLTNLANMNISRNLFDVKIKNLSMGERMKIKINELILSDFNLLMLDEPTNHLDIANREFLEKILKSYKGSCIIVSHDKNFLSNICTKKFEICNNQIKEYKL